MFLNHSKILACAVCYGNPNSTEAKALTWAVFVLLMIIGSVLVGFARFMWRLKKMEKQHQLQNTESARKAG